MKLIRFFLVPFALLYGMVTYLRNKCFDLHFIKTIIIPGKSICVGNLSVGGTGKSPHVSYLANLLMEYDPVILSRGYGRKTNGFIQADDFCKVTDIGDEPLAHFQRFLKKVAVFVCENRSFGVAKIREKYQGPIILDDGFQHRKVKAGLSIVLTEYNRLFTEDYMMPYGRLREFSSGVKRADYLIVSKCPVNISYSEKSRISDVLPFNKNRIYFSEISYGSFVSVGKSIDYLIKHVLLVTGIANPKPLFAYLAPNYKVDSISFLDHHLFTISDIKKIHSKFESLKKEGGILLTTEKDYMRLLEFKDQLKNFPWFFIPIDIKLDNEAQFKKEIISYVTRV